MKKRLLAFLFAGLLSISAAGCGNSAASQPTGNMTATPTTAVSTNRKSNTKAKDYVLNTSSKKFHNPSCPSVKQMKSENRGDVKAVRADLIEDGYSPCKRCNP